MTPAKNVFRLLLHCFYLMKTSFIYFLSQIIVKMYLFTLFVCFCHGYFRKYIQDILISVVFYGKILSQKTFMRFENKTKKNTDKASKN